ncbi:hypothetical protein D9619_004291 [Psilocybe cf. subviscida]|uniref:AB hydrolase-1 domain-containing protein n=1 Tax=Psilocybe cf. subviscida TaxID=2480587 RepID=A0A8H5BPR1_9AGAR|nr:hypothetical protein D9619_004291 [Psilocybe cf. subviscida]
MFSIPEPKLYRDTLFAIFDSGVPPNSTDYTTLVLIHGAGSHSGQFHPLLPFAASHNARLVLLNKRDYKGSVPVPSEEVQALVAAATLPDDAAREVVLAYKRARTREFFDFLCAFAKHEHIPLPRVDPTHGSTGGMVITGWSAGTMILTGLLANVAGYKSTDGFDLRPYVRHVVLYDGPHRILGYIPAEGIDGYNPLFDPEVPLADRSRMFSVFASGYYDHGDVPGVYEDRHALPEPRPTTLTIPDEERVLTADPAPMRPGGSELTMISLGKKLGTFEVLKNEMLYLDGDHGDDRVTKADEDRDRSWDNLEVHVVWGERSVWEIPKGAYEMQKEVEAGSLAGKRMRKVIFTKVKGGNHFFHRERPDEALKLFLNDPERS